jgi:DNA-binding transcriptional LysR family regulator
VDRLSDMQVFVRVVEDCGFSAAGHSSSLSPLATGKAIARLEDRLRVPIQPLSAQLNPDAGR